MFDVAACLKEIFLMSRSPPMTLTDVPSEPKGDRVTMCITPFALLGP